MVAAAAAGLATEQSYEGNWVGGDKQGTGVYRYRRSDGTVYEVGHTACLTAASQTASQSARQTDIHQLAGSDRHLVQH